MPKDFLQDEISEKRHLFFATQDQLDQLKQAKRWYLDGTFKVVKAPYTQLLTIHAFIKQGDAEKQVPLAFFLMSSRQKVD